MKHDGFLTTEEVLEYLNVNLRTVYRLIRAGKIPAVRVGRQWRFRKSDIDEWLARQTAVDSTDSEQPVRSSTPPPRATGRQRVLVVDDEPSIRDLLSKALALADYDVDIAPNGQEALEFMKQRAYNLLITDLRMPGLDGLTVIGEARCIHAGLPVIVVTGFSTEASAIEAANVGVSGYLTKPFKIPRVLEVAARALGE